MTSKFVDVWIRSWGTLKMSTLNMSKTFWTTVETRMKEPTFLGNSLLKDLIFCLYNPYIRDRWRKCEFDKDMQKLYIYNSCILSYNLFYYLSYFYENVILNFSLKFLIIWFILCGFLLCIIPIFKSRCSSDYRCEQRLVSTPDGFVNIKGLPFENVYTFLFDN